MLTSKNNNTSKKVRKCYWLTMCSWRGDSAWTQLSDEDISVLYPASLMWGDTAGTKSCTSASTGGGEGCLIISIWAEVSVSSKDIREGDSWACWGWLSSIWVRIESKSDLWSSMMLLSLSFRDSSSKGRCRLHAHREKVGWTQFKI